MTRLLHVSASPMNGLSFSHRVAASFVDVWRTAHPDSVVDELNVWSEPLPEFDAAAASWKGKMMAGQTPTAQEVASVEQVLDVGVRFQAATHYVFSVPMWNFSVPYRLKHYLDVLVQPGSTFAFDPAVGFTGLVPADRPVLLVLSRGNTAYGPGEPMGHYEHQESYMRSILGFIGLTDVRTITVECTAYPAEVCEPLVSAACARAEAMAPAF